jgi:hypothetical protein
VQLFAYPVYKNDSVMESVTGQESGHYHKTYATELGRRLQKVTKVVMKNIQQKESVTVTIPMVVLRKIIGLRVKRRKSLQL